AGAPRQVPRRPELARRRLLTRARRLPRQRSLHPPESRNPGDFVAASVQPGAARKLDRAPLGPAAKTLRSLRAGERSSAPDEPARWLHRTSHFPRGASWFGPPMAGLGEL